MNICSFSFTNPVRFEELLHKVVQRMGAGHPESVTAATAAQQQQFALLPHSAVVALLLLLQAIAHAVVVLRNLHELEHVVHLGRVQQAVAQPEEGGTSVN